MQKVKTIINMLFIAFWLLNCLFQSCNMLAQPKGFTDDPYVNDEKFIEKGIAIYCKIYVIVFVIYQMTLQLSNMRLWVLLVKVWPYLVTAPHHTPTLVTSQPSSSGTKIGQNFQYTGRDSKKWMILPFEIKHLQLE